MLQKQTSLKEHGVDVITTFSISEEKQPETTAIIVKLEPAAYGRCSLCNRWATLRFCLEYFNNEGVMTLWGEICGDCKLEWEKRRETA